MKSFIIKNTLFIAGMLFTTYCFSASPPGMAISNIEVKMDPGAGDIYANGAMQARVYVTADIADNFRYDKVELLDANTYEKINGNEGWVTSATDNGYSHIISPTIRSSLNESSTKDVQEQVFVSSDALSSRAICARVSVFDPYNSRHYEDNCDQNVINIRAIQPVKYFLDHDFTIDWYSNTQDDWAVAREYRVSSNNSVMAPIKEIKLSHGKVLDETDIGYTNGTKNILFPVFSDQVVWQSQPTHNSTSHNGLYVMKSGVFDSVYIPSYSYASRNITRKLDLKTTNYTGDIATIIDLMFHERWFYRDDYRELCNRGSNGNMCSVYYINNDGTTYMNPKFDNLNNYGVSQNYSGYMDMIDIYGTSHRVNFRYYDDSISFSQ